MLAALFSFGICILSLTLLLYRDQLLQMDILGTQSAFFQFQFLYSARRHCCFSTSPSLRRAFAKHTDVRKFGSERILCARCDKWLSVSDEDHPRPAVVQISLQHRDACQKTVSALKNAMPASPLLVG